jgi:hypothetical protein
MLLRRVNAIAICGVDRGNLTTCAMRTSHTKRMVAYARTKNGPSASEKRSNDSAYPRGVMPPIILYNLIQDLAASLVDKRLYRGLQW